MILGLAGGHINISVTPWVSQSILPHALARFRALRPEIRINVHETLGCAHPALRDGTLDLMIGRPLAGSTSLRDLGGQDWVLTMAVDELAEPLAELLRPYGVDPRPEHIHFAQSAFIAISMLEVGNMLTMCPWPLPAAR